MTSGVPSIRFRLDPRSGVAPYRQLVQQVRDALAASRLKPGDQLPPVREVVTQITINPNTVHRAYRELEYLGITEARWGLGTFVTSAQVTNDASDYQLSVAEKLAASVRSACLSGLSDDEIMTMVKSGLDKEIGVDSLSEMVDVLEAKGLGRRYRRRWALQDCTVSIPQGRVAALVGPNGAGKSTLLRLAGGLIPPSAGSLRVLGEDPQMRSVDLRQRVGYLDQDLPMYSSFRVEEVLHFGRSSNPTWNMDIARRHLIRLNIPLDARVSNLSGGQRAQVALTVCLAKEPELLLLDEPAAELDPVAREELLRLLTQQVAESGSSVVLSTHALTDVSAICDFVVVLARSRVVLANDIEYVLESHRFLSASRDENLALPPGVIAVEEQHTAREMSFIARIELPLFDSKWHVEEPTLEEIVMAYLRSGAPRQFEIGTQAEGSGESGPQ